MFITSTGNSFTTTSTDTIATYAITTKKRRSRSLEFTEYSVHKPNAYKSFLKANSISNITAGKHHDTREFYFGYLWITGIYHDFITKETVIVKPKKQLCRLADRNQYSNAKIDYVDDFDTTPYCVIEIEGFNFNSKKIKKCFTKQEAEKHYQHLKEEYLKKVESEKQKLNEFITQI